MTQSLDLALVGNSSVAALVDAAGEITWACMPRLDDDAVFCSLLRERRGADDDRRRLAAMPAAPAARDRDVGRAVVYGHGNVGRPRGAKRVAAPCIESGSRRVRTRCRLAR